MRVAAAIVLSQPERKKRETGASQRSAAVRLREGARMVLRAAAGLPHQAIVRSWG